MDNPTAGIPLGISDPVLVRDLARLLGQKPFVVIGDLMKLGRPASANHRIDFKTAAEVARHYGFDPHPLP